MAAAVAVACTALAGCGSGTPPSALDPARVVPGNAIVYAEATVRPQGAQRDGLESALTKLVGHSPDTNIQRAIHIPGLSYAHDIQPWLGQRIGFVATAFSLGGVAFIAPTNDPAAAVAAIERAERSRGRLLISGKYGGVSYRQFPYHGVTGVIGAVGHYAVIGGTSAFRAIVNTYQGHTPALNLPASGALARAYVNEPRALAAVMTLPTISPAVRQQLQTVFARTHVPTSVTVSVSASAHALTADLHSSGAPAPSARNGAADVSGAPGNSWLAISSGNSVAKYVATGLNAGLMQSFGTALRARGLSAASVLGEFRRRTGIDLTNDLLPALGPFQLSVQGSTLTTLVAMLELSPSNPFAGGRLLSDVHRLVERDHSLRVIGGSQSFRFGPASLPFPIVGVADVGQRIIAKFALSNAQPATGTLSANPTFTGARAQLPAGSTVPAFLDFGPLAALLSQTPQFKAGGRDQTALAVLRRLDYLVVGVNSADHDVRIALGLH